MKLNYVRASDADKERTRRILADQALRAIYAGPTTVAQMRAATAELAAFAAVRRVREDVSVEPEPVGGVACELLVPKGAAGDRVILYLHGGAFVRGSLELGRPDASWLAALSGTCVVAIAYRQAPEHPYPAAAKDLQTVYAELLARGVAAKAITVVGESSGGSLALGLAAAVAAGGLPAPAGIAALSPLVDLELRGASWLFNADKDVAHIDIARSAIGLYIREPQIEEPLASPLRHHFRECCPLLLAIGSHETMLSDTERLAHLADAAGTEVTFTLYEEMPHGFTRFTTAIGTQALADTARWCRERTS